MDEFRMYNIKQGLIISDRKNPACSFSYVESTPKIYMYM